MREACGSAATALRLVIAEYLDEGRQLPDPGCFESADAVFAVEVSDAFIAETKCVTSTEAADMLGVSVGRVCQMLVSGQLEAYQSDGKRLVTIASVNARKAAKPKAGRPKKDATVQTSYRLTAVTSFGNVEWHDLKAADDGAAVEEAVAMFDGMQYIGSYNQPHYNEARVVRVNRAESGNLSETNLHTIL